MLNPNKFIKVVTPLALAIALSACGGGSGFDNGAKAGGGTGGGGTGGGGTGTEEPLVYTLGQMNIGLTSLSAGGSTGITVELKDQNGDLAKTSQTVTFTSPCIANGTSEVVSPRLSYTGIFTTTYTAKGCEGSDVIKAEVGALESVGTINVQAANLGAVEFVSAEPQSILLKGMSAAGKYHTSTVTFQIKNDAGGPIANEDVSFELTTNVGGITLTSAVGKTDNQGFVSTILQAGTVNTPVRVRAIVERGSTRIESESSQLMISTGIADQNSLSLSLTNLNPSAWDYDGEKVGVNVYASDRYDTPVPDGTTVSFYTELGQIEPSCQTENGACTVNWTSSNPRDLGTLDVRYPRDGVTSNSDGIATITASVIGEESFIDTNSNGIFDDGDQLDSIADRGEAFEDYNMGYNVNGVTNSYDEGLEPYLDFNGNGVYDPKDGKYTGLGCAHSTLCASDKGLKNIFTSIELVMAETNQNYRIYEKSNINLGAEIDTIRNNVTYAVEIFGANNNQVPPSGTSINSASDEAKIVVGSAKVASTNQHHDNLTVPRGGYFMDLRVKDKDDTEREDGFVKITIKTPKGSSVTYFIPYLDQ